MTKDKYIEINGQLRGPDGRFYSNGGVKSEKRDKSCPYCGVMIMRKSKTCRKCWQLGDKSINWRNGSGVYFSIHNWVKRTKGKASECINCGATKNIEWANKSHEYKRITDDWISLCKKCHAAYDKPFWGEATKLFNINQKQ